MWPWVSHSLPWASFALPENGVRADASQVFPCCLAVQDPTVQGGLVICVLQIVGRALLSSPLLVKLRGPLGLMGSPRGPLLEGP